MVETVIVDAEGKRLPKPRLKRNKNVKYNSLWQRNCTPILPRPPNPVSETLANISKLEDAIFEDKEYRAKYLNIYRDLESAEEDFDAYLMKHNIRKKKALIHCWETLGWRPSSNGKQVINAKNNPYIK